MVQSLPTSDKRVKSTIYEISFGEYVEAVVGNVSVLGVSPNVTDEELTEARKKVMCEFADLTGDLNYINQMQVNTRIMKLGIKIMELTIAYNLLSLNCTHENFKMLKDLGIIPSNAKFPTTIDELTAVLKRVKSKSDILNIDIQELQQQVEQKEDSGKEKKHERKDFIGLLASVSQFIKFGVGFDTNCALIAEYTKRLKEYSEREQAKKG